jgi:hypothetical protein
MEPKCSSVIIGTCAVTVHYVTSSQSLYCSGIGNESGLTKRTSFPKDWIKLRFFTTFQALKLVRRIQNRDLRQTYRTFISAGKWKESQPLRFLISYALCCECHQSRFLCRILVRASCIWRPYSFLCWVELNFTSSYHRGRIQPETKIGMLVKLIIGFLCVLQVVYDTVGSRSGISPARTTNPCLGSHSCDGSRDAWRRGDVPLLCEQRRRRSKCRA